MTPAEQRVDVLAQERGRRRYWRDLGLPDPVQVLAEERSSEVRLGERWRSPKRELLREHFEQHPEVFPYRWSQDD